MSTRITFMDYMADDARLWSELEASAESRMGYIPTDAVSCTLIQTANSSYLFLVTDATEHRGMLVGGAVGEDPAHAVLLNAAPGASRASDYTLLKSGGCAVFLVELDGGWRRIVTSPIVQIVHTPLPSRAPLVAVH